MLAAEVATRHRQAHEARPTERAHRELEVGGEYQWRREGEFHLFNPKTVFKLQHATRSKRYEIFKEYTAARRRPGREAGDAARPAAAASRRRAARSRSTRWSRSTSILSRFSTGAMSYGSISAEAHETLAIAMNRLGGRSNTGEGGEDADRFTPDANGDLRRSAIKQVASGRFGVTSEYLVNADDLQIKISQGAKPGEGGQLAGIKVYPWIARTRNSTPGVGLISPPPHHDIYSIEDIAQLIHDLKSSNPRARVHVKLVAEVGVGTVAAGVAKAHSDVVLISGHDGGTGAAPLTSLKHAGIPWEIGLAETQQTLLVNGLRDRIVVQVDGQLKTGRDVLIGALLGAEEYGFATAPLVVSGCIMMRVCHLDTCPVGIATQNPALRAKFSGKPEFVETFFEYIAEEVRELLASLGLRSLDEAIGRVDLLDTETAVTHWKAAGLDLSTVLAQPDVPAGVGRRQTAGAGPRAGEGARPRLPGRSAPPALADAIPVSVALPITNVDRTVGTLLGSEISRRHGAAGLPDDTISLTFTGSAGQSFGAFVPRGVTMRLLRRRQRLLRQGALGRAARRAPARRAHPSPPRSRSSPATSSSTAPPAGEVFIRGQVGERFCVRNSGATAVVEGVGDHGCEYMTGGLVAGARADRAQLRRRHVGRDRLRLRPGPDVRAAGQPRDGRRRAARPRRQPSTVRSLVERHGVETESAVAAAPARALGHRGPRIREGHAERLPPDPRGHPSGRGRGALGRRGRHGGRTWVRRPASWSSGGSCRGGGRSRCACATGARSTSPSARSATKEQGARCMDCGIPFCHDGCPLGNLIPEWNDLVYRDDWPDAMERLHATNNFPEFTGRLCPAPCEAACVLGINEDPVTIERIEYEIVERAWDEGWVTPQLPTVRTGKSVAVVGSGPAGLAAAQQLARAGHLVTVFERAEKPGGLLRYGIPEFKMEKAVLDRRLAQMEAEGVTFVCSTSVGGRLRRGLPPEVGDVDGAGRGARARDGLRARRRGAAGRRGAGRRSTRSCWRAGRRCRGTCRCPGASSAGVHFAWST